MPNLILNDLMHAGLSSITLFTFKILGPLQSSDPQSSSSSTYELNLFCSAAYDVLFSFWTMMNLLAKLCCECY